MIFVSVSNQSFLVNMSVKWESRAQNHSCFRSVVADIVVGFIVASHATLQTANRPSWLRRRNRERSTKGGRLHSVFGGSMVLYNNKKSLGN